MSKEQQTVEAGLEPKATQGLEIGTAVRIIGSRVMISKAGYYALKVISDPTPITVELEDDPLFGEEVYLVNLAGTTPDLKQRSMELLKHAVELHKAGDTETAELFAQDSASQVLVRRVRVDSDWIPTKGEIVKAMVQRVVPENGPNAGKPVFRVTSIAPMPIETNTKNVSFDKDLAESLGELGIDSRALRNSSSEDDSDDLPEDVDDSPTVE